MIPKWAIYAIGGAALVAFIFLAGMRVGGKMVEADWNQSILAQRDAVDKEKEALRERNHKLATENSEFQRKAKAGMFNIRKDQQNEISSTPSLRDCNATAGFLRGYNAARSGAELPATGR